MFDNKFMNHDLVFHYKYNNICIFYKCNRCDMIINHFSYLNGIHYEEVYLYDSEKWATKYDTDIKIFSCEELVIKRLLE